MMELGAMVCTGSAAPNCQACPVRSACAAHQRQYAWARAPDSSTAEPRVTDYPAKVLIHKMWTASTLHSQRSAPLGWD